MAHTPWPPGVTDAYLAWARASNFADYQKATSYVVAYEIPLLPAAVRSIASMNAGWSAFKSPMLALGAGSVQLHPHWWSDDFTSYGTATMDARGLAALALLQTSGIVSRYEVGLALTDQRMTAPDVSPVIGPGSSSPELCKPTVMYGLVDFGCPYAHAKLRTTGGTSRILNFWNQSPEAPSAAMLPSGYGFGKAMLSADIDAMLATTFDPSRPSDEASAYQQAGSPELMARASHGAHMLGLLFDPEISPSFWSTSRDAAPTKTKNLQNTTDHPDTVFVQLPPSYQQGMPRSAFGPHRLAALRYIVGCAGTNTEKIIVPLSSENWDGSHDGQSLFEKALDALVEFVNFKSTSATALIVFVAAGNNLRAESQLTADISASQSAQFDVRLLPGNERPTFVEVWLPNGADVSKISVTSPQGAAVFVEANQAVLDVARTQAAGSINVIDAGNRWPGKRCIVFRFAPSLTHDTTAAASVGDWKIGIEVKDTTALLMHAFVARSFHGVGGKRRSYQSYLPNIDWNSLMPSPLLEEFPDRGTGSVNALANGANIAGAIGGYRIWDLSRAKYSAAGPSTSGGRHAQYKVDAAAPSEESPSLLGLRSWGNSSGAGIRRGGTSVSTPLAGRLAWQHGPNPPKTPVPHKPPNKSDDQNHVAMFQLIT